MTRGDQARGGGLAAVLGSGVPWAGPEDSLKSIVRAARRRLAGGTPSSGPRASRPEPDALAARSGRRLEGARRVAVREGGVAVVPVVGPLFRRANLFTSIFQATTLETLARDFAAALESDDVRVVLLDVDSPGGEANGVSELSDMIHAAQGSGTRVVAHVGGLGASGAYWIASAAEEVVASDAAVLGSVGIAATLEVPGGGGPGERRVEVVSSQTPAKRPDPTEEDGRAQVQRVVDDLAGVMLSDLARNRGLPGPEAAAERFGRGSLFVGEHAVRRDLADRVATFEATVSALAEDRPPAAAGSEPREPVEPGSHHQEAPVTTSASRTKEHEDEDRAARLLVAAARSEPPEEVELSPAPPVAPAAERGEAAEARLGSTRGDGEARRAAAAIVEAARSGREAEGKGETARTALDHEEAAADDAAEAIVAASRRRQRGRSG